MNNLMREEFEIWVKKRAVNSPAGFIPQLLFRCALDPNRYMISWVDSAFEGWQASRECLVIELPKPRVARGYGEQVAEALGFNDGINYCEESIHAAGVKTK